MQEPRARINEISHPDMPPKGVDPAYISYKIRSLSDIIVRHQPGSEPVNRAQTLTNQLKDLEAKVLSQPPSRELSIEFAQIDHDLKELLDQYQ